MRQPLWAIIMFVLLISFVKGEYGISYNLTPTVSDWLGSSQIQVMETAPDENIVFIGSIDGKLGYYNASSNTSTDLTPTTIGWLPAASYWSMAYDSTHRLLYFTNGQVIDYFGYYNLSDNTSTKINPGIDWNYFTKIIYDKQRDLIWFSSNDGNYGFYNPRTNMKHNIGISGWAYALCFDDVRSHLYMGFIGDSSYPKYYDVTDFSEHYITGAPLNLESCDVDTLRNIVYWGGVGFDYNGYYLQDTDTYYTALWTGDGSTVETTYMPNSNTVGFAFTSGYGSGNIYDPVPNTSISLDTTGDWLIGIPIMWGDYDNISRRYYMGFYYGEFGYFDNNIMALCQENWTVAYTACDITDSSIKYYIDQNMCGTTDYLPIDNNTIVPCNYCSENIVNVTTPCILVGSEGKNNVSYLDNNYYSCCVLTNFTSDCDILYSPYNETMEADCALETTQFDVDYDTTAYFGVGKDKVYWKINLNRSGDNYTCVSFINTMEGNLIQTNPNYGKRTDSILQLTGTGYEDRDFFPTHNGIANIYFTNENLIIDGRQYIFGVECSGNNETLLTTRIVNVGYEAINAPITRYFWAGNNIVPIIIGILIIIALAMFVGYIWRRAKYG